MQQRTFPAWKDSTKVDSLIETGWKQSITILSNREGENESERKREGESSDGKYRAQTNHNIKPYHKHEQDKLMRYLDRRLYSYMWHHNDIALKCPTTKLVFRWCDTTSAFNTLFLTKCIPHIHYLDYGVGFNKRNLLVSFYDSCLPK